MSAMEYIGDDLIERAAADMEAPAPRGMAIWTKGIAAAACVSLIVGGVYYAGVLYWNETENVSTDLPSLNAGGSSAVPSVQTSEKVKPATSVQTTVGSELTTPETGGGILLYTMEDIYPYYEKESMFAKMRIDTFQGVYNDKYGKPYLSVNCTVITDYYDTIEDGMEFVLNIDLLCSITEESEKIYYNEQDMIEFLSQFDCLFVYAYVPMITIYYPDNSIQVEQEMASEVFFFDYSIIPVSDGKLDIQSLKNFWIKCETFYTDDWMFSDTKFWKYVQDGLDESVFAEYIRENKERQIGGTQ